MPKLTKRTIDATDIRASDYVLWDDDLPGFGLRVFKSGKRSYVVQYRTAGRSRRVTIGLHGVWTPIHTVDTALVMAADSIAGYIQGLLDGVAFTRTAYALDRDTRKSALAHFLGQTSPADRQASHVAA